MGVLDGKVAVVTGSARGIGRATAELLAEQGARVLINDLDGDVAEQAAEEIDGATVAFAGDLTHPGVPEEMIKRVVDEWGRLDIVVNNAGVMLLGPIEDAPTEEWERMIDLNLKGLLYVTRAAVRKSRSDQYRR